MAKLIKQAVIQSDKGRLTGKILFDTGAWSNFIRRQIAEAIGTPQSLRAPRVVSLADGRRKVQAHEAVLVHVFWQNRPITTSALVVDHLAFDIIIGAATMEEYDMILHMRKGRIALRGPSRSTQLMSSHLLPR